MAAPCQLVEDPKSQFVQTYVVKAAEDVASPILGTWAASQGVLGAGAWSVVEVEEQVCRELYLVVTFRNAHRFKPRVDYIKESLYSYQRTPPWSGFAHSPVACNAISAGVTSAPARQT